MTTDNSRKLTIVLIFSAAFNVAFVGMWMYHMLCISPALEKVQQDQAALNEKGTLMLQKLDELRLAPEQRRSIMAQQAGLRQEVGSAMQQAQQARAELLTLMEDPNADPEALRAAEGRFAAEQQKVRQMVFEHMLQMRGTLDDNQRREFGRMLGGRFGRQPGKPPMFRQGRPGPGQNQGSEPRPDDEKRPDPWQKEPF